MSNYFWHSFSVWTELQQCKFLKSENLITTFGLGNFNLSVCFLNKFTSIKLCKLDQSDLIGGSRIVLNKSILIFLNHDFMTQVQNSQIIFKRTRPKLFLQFAII